MTSQPTQAGRSCDRGCPSAKTRSHRDYLAPIRKLNRNSPSYKVRVESSAHRFPVYFEKMIAPDTHARSCGTSTSADTDNSDIPGRTTCEPVNPRCTTRMHASDLCLGWGPATGRRINRTGGRRNYKLTQRWRQWRTGVGGHQGGPQPKSCTGSCGQSSDSESRSLRTAELAQPAWQRHSPAPTGVRRGTSDGHYWTGSKAVETAASRVGRAAEADD